MRINWLSSGLSRAVVHDRGIRFSSDRGAAFPVRERSCVPDCSPLSRVESPIRCRPIGRHGSASVVLRDVNVVGGDRLPEDIPAVTRGDLAEGTNRVPHSRTASEFQIAAISMIL